MHITNRLPMFHQHVFVILLWGILMSPLRDWSLFTGRTAYKMGKSRVRSCLRPVLSRQGKTCHTPCYIECKLFAPLLNIVKTSSYRVKTTPKLVVPPFSMATTFSAPPFRRGKTAPPLPFCSLLPLAIISDQSLGTICLMSE